MKSKTRISIDFPLKGVWRFLRPPGHHPFAFDFVKMDDKRKKYSRASKFNFLFSNISAEDYYCWSEPVFSPVDGIVLQMGLGWHDNIKTSLWKTIKIWYRATYKSKPEYKNGKLDIRPNVGNYVMIQTKEGYIVFLAHLKNDSILVKQGQFIKAGDLIAMVGNSGNSTAPHLHINLFDQMTDPLSAKVLAFVFNQYKQLSATGKWENYILNVPEVKSFIKLE